jgi:hypothetical protein
MKATTVKVDGELLRAIEEVKPPSQTVTAYVRSVLQKAVEKHCLQAAALAYRAFMEAHQEEQQWLKEWDDSDLASTPSTGGHRG